MIDLETLEHALMSDLPISIERAMYVLRKALFYYPLLKETLMSGSIEEKKNAKKLGLFLIARMNEEFCSANEKCKTQIGPEQIAALLTPQELKVFQEAFEWIQKNSEELFSRPKVNKKIAMKPKIRIAC